VTNIAAFISLQDLGYPKPTFRDAVNISRGVNRRTGIAILAKLNVDICLANFTHNLKIISNTQIRVISQIISERHQRELADKLRNERVHERPLVHRAQMLAAIKFVALFGNETSGNVFQKRDDFDILGELALTINSLFDFGTFDSKADERINEREIVKQMGPLFELNNPEAPINGMVRIREMLGNILEKEKWKKQLKNDEESLKLADQFERIFVFITGIGFEAYRDMTFAVYSYYFGNRQQLLDGVVPISFNPFASGNLISWSAIKGFLEQSSTSLEGLVDSLNCAEGGNRFLLNYTCFRERPIMRLGPKQFFCVDPGFLLEKLTSGFFWSVMNALGEGGEDEDRDRTLAFSRLWGSLFEEYVLRRLEDAYSYGSCSPLLSRPKYDDGNEAFDAAIDFGELLIVIQIKGLFVNIDAKFSGDADKFMEGINEKFGMKRGAAIEQHYRNIQLAFDADPKNRCSIQGLDVSKTKLIFPLGLRPPDKV
jgi:hypothetical protein